MYERGGNVMTKVVADRRGSSLLPVVRANVLPHSEVHTDELRSYEGLGSMGYWHKSVNHRAKEYVSDTGTTVNGMEGYWASLKRGINGTHIHVSPKHLPKYLAEFEYRWNMRATPQLMLDRLMVSFVR